MRTARLLGSAAVAAALGLVGPAASAGGFVFTVNAFDDLPDADPGDGVCDADLAAPDPQCTLRAAVQEANATLAPDLIELPAGVFRLTRQGSGEDAAATGDLDLLQPVTLRGAGRELTVVDGKKAKDRVFDAYGNATFEQLTIRGGQALISDELGGGGIRALGALANVTVRDVLVTKNKSRDDAGGIYLEMGSVLIEDSVISANKTADDGGGLDADGGQVTFLRTTLWKNKAGDEGGGFESSGANAFVANSTLSGNKAQEGGAMNLEEASTTTVVGSTIAKNKAKQGSGIYLEDGDGGLHDALSIQNTIVANKPTTNCTGEPIDTSFGSNLDSGSTCGLAGPGDQSGVDPRLLKLADNGGKTPTHALRADSPAIDGGGVCGKGLATDQRGQPRVDVPGVGPGTDSCDIGAFEFVP